MFQNLFKISLVSGLILLCSQCAFLICGYNPHIAEYTGGLSLFAVITLFVSTFALNLCNLSRCILLYNYTMSSCINIQRDYQIFGEYVDIVRCIMLLAGLVIIALLILKKARL